MIVGSSGNYRRSQVVQFSDAVLDRLIAPEASKFTELEMPELQVADSYTANFFLHNIFLLEADVMGPFIALFLRRIEQATRDYHAARETLLEYIGHLPHHYPGKMLRGITLLEQFLASVCQAAEASHHVARHYDRSIGEFKKGTDDKLRKLIVLYEVSKHAHGTLRYSASPIWPTKQGLRCLKVDHGKTKDIYLSFIDIVSIVSDPLSNARWISTDFYHELAERRRQT
jgi:hypothetical protein